MTETVDNARALLQYAIDREVAIDPVLVLQVLDGEVSRTDLGLPVLTATREDDA